MGDPWPWLAVAGLGALHGLSPASGWVFVAARGLRGGDRRQAWRALLPVAAAHVAAIAAVAAAVAQGIAVDRVLCQWLAGAALLGAAACLLPRCGAVVGQIGGELGSKLGLGLGAVLAACAHGAGMMLVPALVPLCLADGPARAITASGSMVLALAAVGVHLAAMLLAAGGVAALVCRGLALHPRLQRAAASRQVGAAVLALVGVMLIVPG